MLIKNIRNKLSYNPKERNTNEKNGLLKDFYNELIT